jgi:hypothetical protein
MFDGLSTIIFSYFQITKEAFKTRFYKKNENWYVYLSLVAFFYLILVKGHYGLYLDFLCLSFLRPMFLFIVRHLSYLSLLLTVFTLVGGLIVLIFGLKPYKKFRRYQKGLDQLNLKSGLDHKPKLLAVHDIDDNRTRLLVKSSGLGEDRYNSRLDDFRASIGQRVESVRFFEKDNTCVEIFLAKRLLESRVLYSSLSNNLKQPYSFIVGKSQNGVVIESLENVPHYMIAGSTGGGKSVSFKSMLIGLLESSNRIQMYLFDFKRVEMNDFIGLPNVVVVNEEIKAQQILQYLEKEMERRYQMLEKGGFKSIDPVRDNCNRIVVGIDECTDLTGKVAKSNPQYVTIEKARNSLDHLARKARACGIHLIFATQKIDSDTLGTRIQENVEGRIALRMNTMENSVRVLQNSMAYHLPAIPGRAIWKKGSGYTEIQSPYLDDEELQRRVKELIQSKKFHQESLLKDAKDKERGNEGLFVPNSDSNTQ